MCCKILFELFDKITYCMLYVSKAQNTVKERMIISRNYLENQLIQDIKTFI